MEHYFYRVEFQHRGSPHIHGLAWIKHAPKFDVQNNEEVCPYIDKIIACTSSVPEDEQDYVKLQKHQHSKTCQKKEGGQTKCRFGALWAPMRNTAILRPLDSEHLQHQINYIHVYQ